MDEVLAKLAHHIADNCLMHGENDRQHDVALLILFYAARLNDIKFKARKMPIQDYSLREYTYRSHAGTGTGTTKGMVNYMKRYTRAKLCHPLCELIKANNL